MSVKKSLGWMALAQITSVSVQFASSVVVARYLTPYETGIFAVGLAMVAIISILQALGLQALIVREQILTEDIKATAFTVNAIIGVILASITAGLSYAGGSFLREPGVQEVLLALAVTPLIGILSFLPAALLEREGQFKTIALIGTGGAVVGSIGTIVMAIYGFSYMSLAYSQWVSGLVYAIAMNVAGRGRVTYRVGFAAWRRVADFGLQMLAVSGITTLSLRLSEVVLGRLLGLNALGIYSRAVAMNGLIWSNMHTVVGRVLLVDFAQTHRSGTSLRDRYLRTVAVITATLWPAFAGLALVAKPLIYHVYGEKWVPAAEPLMLLALASMLQVAITMTWEVFAATGNLRVQTRIEFIRALLAFGAFVAGCTIGLIAAAAARVFDAIVALILYRPHLNRMTGTCSADLRPIYAQSALLVVLACSPAGMLMGYFRMSAQVPVFWLAAAVVSGILLWLAGLVLLRHSLAVELKKLLLRRRPLRG